MNDGVWFQIQATASYMVCGAKNKTITYFDQADECPLDIIKYVPLSSLVAHIPQKYEHFHIWLKT